MVELTIVDEKLKMQVRGVDQLWAFKSTLEIPLTHIAGIRADPEIAHAFPLGLRMPGTNVPGVITAGTFFQEGKRVFWDVRNPDNAIVIDLLSEKYQQLIIEVGNPENAVQMLMAELP